MSHMNGNLHALSGMLMSFYIKTAFPQIIFYISINSTRLLYIFEIKNKYNEMEAPRQNMWEVEDFI